MNTTRRNQIVHYAKCFFAQYKWALALLMFASFMSVQAQQTTGTILGTVKDQTGALINTATVKATNVDTGFSETVKTNSYGEYRIDQLPVGKYTVVAEAASFKKFVQQNLTLDVEQQLTVDIPLSVGAISDTVTVETAPPQINTSTQELGRTVEADEIVALPLVNRNVYSELTLTPGITANNNSAEKNPSGTPTFAVGLPEEDVQVNGSTDGGAPEVGFYLDGGNNITGMRNYGNPAPNPDALAEFRVETSAFGAQYGQYSAAVVTAITKSGTNRFHGGAFEFARTTALNDSPWVNPIPTYTAPSKQHYRKNQFGGFVGGPILRNKAFFFFSYAGLRQITGAVIGGGTTFTPTAAERLGDFTADSTKVNTPGTTTQVKGTNSSPNCAVATLNCIPATLLDPTISNFDNCSNTLGSCIPLPTGAAHTTTGGGVYQGSFTTRTTTDEYLGKYDEAFGQKDHLSVTYFYSKYVTDPSGGGNIPWTINQSAAGDTNYVVSEVHTFSPNVANQAWVTFTRAAGGRENLPVTGPTTQTLATYGSNFVVQGPPSLPNLSVNNGFTAAATNAGPFTGSDNYQLRDMITWTKGKHSLFLGGEFALDKTMFLANLLNFGNISFTSPTTTTGDGLADWVTGQANMFEQDSPYVTHLSYWYWAAFAQDNYRITPHFTANIGLRWDVETPPVDSHNRTESFNPGQQSTIAPSAPTGLLFPGDAGVTRGIIATEYYHVSPRVGFAWDPFGHGTTSIRAAMGIFYGTTAGNEWNQPGNAIPFAVRPQGGVGQLTDSASTTGTSYNGGYFPITSIYSTPGDWPSTAAGGGLFPYTYNPAKPVFIAGPPGSTEAISTHVKYPYIYQFNLAVQQQLPGKIALTVAYVGALSHNLPNFIDANYAPYSTVFGGPTANNTGAGNVPQRRQFDPCIGAGGCPTGAAAINVPGVLGALIGDLFSNLKSNFHSLQVTASKQLSNHFSISGFYVWGRAMDTFEPDADGVSAPQDSGYLGQPFTMANNSLGAIGGGLQAEYGPESVDNRNTAVMSARWNSDYYHGPNKIVKELISGWEISPVYYLHSGGPFTVSDSAHKNDDSTNANRPDYVPGVSANLSPHRCRICIGNPNSVLNAWFNPAAFQHNGPGVIGGIGPGGADGNVGRDTLYGPGYRDIDLGLYKTFTIEHGIAFQIRAEATNAFNMVSLSNPASGFNTSSSFGLAEGQEGTSRIIQLGGKLTF
jgi:hypothetical protein